MKGFTFLAAIFALSSAISVENVSKEFLSFLIFFKWKKKNLNLQCETNYY